ncbi:hypothetical protein DSO57_1012336 [Entomophthora muscae]|uniref:Uncharacterized protein n=1 Tax=Entomophthora muscae TaxID=34485 RepID=A0ACC2U3T5_9FUNG|nr:hypothetical protein DSO57_1012336 [Entomophthora muscae]
MDKPNDENIHVYERACRVGGPLRLLSVCSTIRQPSRRNSGSPCVTTEKLSKDSPNVSSSRPHNRLQDARAGSKPATPLKNNQTDKNLLRHAVTSETVIDSISELDAKKTESLIILDDTSSLDMSEPATSNPPTDLFDSNVPIVPILETVSKIVTPSESFSTEKSEMPPLDYCQDFDAVELEPISAKQPRQSYTDSSLPFASQLQTNSLDVAPNICLPPHEEVSLAHFKSTPEQTQLSNIPVVGSEEINDTLLSNPTATQLSLPNSLNNTPSKKRLFATCISSANRSPHKGPPGSISQSPTIQLGKKIFHVPGTILLGAPATSPKIVKKKQAQNRRGRNKGMKFDSYCDLTLAETSDPYAFVLQKRAPKPIPASAQDLADILLKPSTPNENILLDDDDDVRLA